MNSNFLLLSAHPTTPACSCGQEHSKELPRKKTFPKSRQHQLAAEPERNLTLKKLRVHFLCQPKKRFECVRSLPFNELRSFTVIDFTSSSFTTRLGCNLKCILMNQKLMLRVTCSFSRGSRRGVQENAHNFLFSDRKRFSYAINHFPRISQQMEFTLQCIHSTRLFKYFTQHFRERTA